LFLLLFSCSNASPEAATPDDQRVELGASTLPLPPAPEVPRLEAQGRTLYESFSPDRAMETARFVDQFFRVRGNEGYHSCLGHLRERLTEAGFPGDDVHTLELGPERQSWTPVRARLELLGSEPGVLHAFDDETGRDRATLLVGSHPLPPTELEVVLESSSGSFQGKVVLGRGSPRSLFHRAVVMGGAAGILTLWLDEYHQPEEMPDVAQFGYLPRDTERGFGFSISPRADGRLRQAITSGGGSARVRVAIEVKLGASRATTVEAIIPGSDPGAAPVVFVAHVDEPGAHDNASGVAAQLELARALRQSIEAGRLPRPLHPFVFLWGQELECSSAWLEGRDGLVLAELTFDMVGADPEVTGADFLIERLPDPGAVWLRPPDQPSGWGFVEVELSRVRGHFLTDYAIAAVRARAASHPGWRFRDHPFEGGSDHESFLERGFPGIMVWHFPDAAYHTNLDRLDRLSGEEMRCVSASIGAAAIGMASGLVADRLEMVRAVERGGLMRLRYAAEAARESLETGGTVSLERQIVRSWLEWYDQALSSIPASQGDALDQARDEAGLRLHQAGEVLLRAISDFESSPSSDP
jgi:hypothetical protein